MMKLSAVIGLFFMIWIMHFIVVRSNSRLQLEALGWGLVAFQSTDRINLPHPWLTRDVGLVRATGGATFANNALMIMGAGMDIWGAADEFHYVYQQVSGDCEILARVVSVQNTDPWAKAGVMIRQNLTTNSPFAMVVVTPSTDSGVAFQYRQRIGAFSVDTHTAGVTAPYWVRVARSGNTFTAFRSATGINWLHMGSVNFPMSESVYIGLVVTSHKDRVLCMSTIDNVAVTP